MSKCLVNYILLVCALVIFSSCATVNNRGNFIDNETIINVKNDKATKDILEQIFGPPSIIPDYTKNRWYYVYRVTNARAWTISKTISQQIVQVDFDANERLNDIKVLESKFDDSISANSENSYTKSYGTEQNWIQIFVKNLGRFNKHAQRKK